MKIKGKYKSIGNFWCDVEIELSAEELIRQVIEQDKSKELLIELSAEELIRQVIEQDKSKELLIELDAEEGKKICATEQKEDCSCGYPVDDDEQKFCGLCKKPIPAEKKEKEK